jgi:hypothetical protein
MFNFVHGYKTTTHFAGDQFGKKFFSSGKEQDI